MNFQHWEWVKSKRRKRKRKEREKEERKLVITMASYALQTPPWVANKPPGPKKIIKIVLAF